MHELLIRGGTIVDGTGAPSFVADILIDEGAITGVGRLTEVESREVIDAAGLLVTPGFVDIHTHYDGQISWDSLITPSIYHGVTTVVMGNCGVGFAPVRPDKHDYIIQVMEGVEDIPGAALSVGIRWNWETFPEYLDFAGSLPRTIDVGAQVPHAALRPYVMGERGAANTPATDDEIARLAAIVREAVQAGALGFTSTRSAAHRSITGEHVPGYGASERELFGIGQVLGDLGAGRMEIAPAGMLGDDLAAPPLEMSWMRRLSALTQRPISFGFMQHNKDPRAWEQTLVLTEQARADGAELIPQIAARASGLIVSLVSRVHPFSGCPTWSALSGLLVSEKVARLSEPEIRRQILAETSAGERAGSRFSFDRVFLLEEPLDYEPPADASVQALAERQGRPAAETFYDLMLERDGQRLFYMPSVNYSDFNLDMVREVLLKPYSVMGLGDAGAHVGMVCDASFTTFMLTHWTRDRTRGPRIPVEVAVKKMTQDTASLYGLHDRGTIQTGKLADLNLIDMQRLRLRLPELVRDLPTGAGRLLQKADGYVATLKRGEAIIREGVITGARPGRLIRGEQLAPAAVTG